jgi:hypothetical protein
MAQAFEKAMASYIRSWHSVAQAPTLSVSVVGLAPGEGAGAGVGTGAGAGAGAGAASGSDGSGSDGSVWCGDPAKRLLALDTFHRLATCSGFTLSDPSEGHVWQHCFHKPISRLRQAICSVAPTAPTSPAPPALLHALTLVLDVGTQFYQRLLAHFSPSGPSQGCPWSCHKCLVYLGDLCRYRHMHTQSPGVGGLPLPGKWMGGTAFGRSATLWESSACCCVASGEACMMF